jgi:hypothetical protein
LPHDADDFIGAFLTGGSSKLSGLLRRLGADLPALLAAPPASGTAPARERQQQRRLTPEQIGELVEQYVSGDDMRVLAERWCMHRTTVAGHLQRAGAELRRQGLDDQQLKEAIRLYGEGWSLERLGHR